MILKPLYAIAIVLTVGIITGCGPRVEQAPTRPHAAIADDWRPPTHRAPAQDDLEEGIARFRPDPQPQPTVLDRIVSVSFQNKPLHEATETLGAFIETGITVMSSKDDTPALSARRVSLAMREVMLSDVLDWMMRQVGANYALTPEGIMIASEPARLLPERLQSYAYPLHTMQRFDAPKKDSYDHDAERSATFRCIRLMLAEYMTWQEGASLSLTPGGDAFVAVGSHQAHDRIKQVLREIGRGAEDTPLLEPEHDRVDFQALLEKTINCFYENRPLIDVLEMIGVQAGVNIGVDPRELLEGAEARVTLDFGRASLRFALDSILRQTGLRGYEYEPGRGIWVFRNTNWQRQGRLLWDNGLIRSYYIAPMVGRLSLERLFELVRRNVTPEQWQRGHLPAMAYAPTGRLVVFHNRRGHVQLASYLRSLDRTLRAGRSLEEADLPQAAE